MNKLKGGLILLAIFAASAYCSFQFEESYRKLIRHLYVALSDGKITFFIPKKYLHFGSVEFIISFGLFMIILCFLSYRQTIKQRIVNIALTLFILSASTLIQSYLDSFFKIIECTICNDGTRKLHDGEINYDAIFISSLVLALIPVATTENRRFFKLKKRKV